VARAAAARAATTRTAAVRAPEATRVIRPKRKATARAATWSLVRLLLVQVAPRDNSRRSCSYLAAHTAAPLVHVAPMDAAVRSTTARPDRSEGKLLVVQLSGRSCGCCS
jgi:hypothetical protein